MSQRRFSPIATRKFSHHYSGTDERQQIIVKLKQNLVAARGKQKQVAILSNYASEIESKNKMIHENLKKKESDFKTRTEAQNIRIKEAKRSLDSFKLDSKEALANLGEQQVEEFQLKKIVAKKGSEIERMKKELGSLNQQNKELNYQYQHLDQQSHNLQQDGLKIKTEKRNYEQKMNEINHKIIEVKAYLGDLNDQNKILTTKLRQFQTINNSLSDELEQKQQIIDQLQRQRLHKISSNDEKSERIAELEHNKQKCNSQTRHKLGLLKSQSSKSKELVQYNAKIQDICRDTTEQREKVETENRQIHRVNSEYRQQIEKMKKDYEKCQIHLQNILKNNQYMREKLEGFVKEDQKVILALRNKRSTLNYGQLKQSGKYSTRTSVNF